jgi:hypothetical protein
LTVTRPTPHFCIPMKKLTFENGEVQEADRDGVDEDEEDDEE